MSSPPSKKEVMLALLERAEARVHLDARRDGVRLPARFLTEPHLRLDYGYGFAPPIPDLTIDDDGIHATLSFSRVPFATFVPWTAVYVIADFEGNGAVWQDDIPSDLPVEKSPPDSGGDGSGSGGGAATTAKPEPPPKKRPGHLKLVK
ncbi:MAG TPA: ClpXP protease specificity-enhancing factor SspB [Polyangia bacterium]|nr:ClpXP protease specificity-enhancing factor SspB [Polyangia bacterium]